MKFVGNENEININAITLCFALSDVGLLKSMRDLSPAETEAANILEAAKSSMSMESYIEGDLINNYLVIAKAIEKEEKVD